LLGVTFLTISLPVSENEHGACKEKHARQISSGIFADQRSKGSKVVPSAVFSPGGFAERVERSEKHYQGE
jgi:hypothetical protein